MSIARLVRVCLITANTNLWTKITRCSPIQCSALWITTFNNKNIDCICHCDSKSSFKKVWLNFLEGFVIDNRYAFGRFLNLAGTGERILWDCLEVQAQGRWQRLRDEASTSFVILGQNRQTQIEGSSQRIEWSPHSRLNREPEYCWVQRGLFWWSNYHTLRCDGVRWSGWLIGNNQIYLE